MLELQGLTRSFGDRVAVDDVSFAVRPGVLTGFIGANGAGKTTTMRIAMGVMDGAGEVLWNGRPATTADRRGWGYMPEERGLYPKMGVLDQLTFLGQLHGMSRREASEAADALLAELGLGERVADKLESLSLGNQQRAQVAAALVHQPDLLILDEPFSGLDPVAVDVMAALLRRRAAQGVPVVFSSHQLELVEKLCDDIVIISEGRVVAAGRAETLRYQRAGLRYRMILGADAGWLHGQPAVTVHEVTGNRVVVDLSAADAAQAVLSTALQHGPVHEFARVVPSLSEIFREVTR